jgi:hypothetical protein
MRRSESRRRYDVCGSCRLLYLRGLIFVRSVTTICNIPNLGVSSDVYDRYASGNANAKNAQTMKAFVDGLERRSCFSFFLGCLLVALSFVCPHTLLSSVSREAFHIMDGEWRSSHSFKWHQLISYSALQCRSPPHPLPVRASAPAPTLAARSPAPAPDPSSTSSKSEIECQKHCRFVACSCFAKKI